MEIPSDLVQSITIKSNLTPDVTVNPDDVGPVLRTLGWVIRPEIDIQTPFGTVTQAPYGTPTFGVWIFGALLVLVVLGLWWWLK